MSSKRIIFISAFLTVLWLVGLAFLVQTSQRCEHGGGIIELWVSCRTTNEIGDFLAGSFAPLAFLWLVATVLIQSSALKKQGEELELAREEQGLIREEMRLTREAVEAQLEEAKRNVELIEKQIDIQGTDSRDSIQRHNADDYEKLVILAIEYFCENIDGKRLYASDGKSYDLAVGDLSGTYSNRIREVCATTNPLLLAARERDAELTQKEHWKALLGIVTQAMDKLDACAESFKRTAVSTGIDDFKENISNLVNE